jgi:hypothetical protein
MAAPEGLKLRAKHAYFEPVSEHGPRGGDDVIFMSGEFWWATAWSRLRIGYGGCWGRDE